MAYADEIQAALETQDVEKALTLLEENQEAHGQELDFFICRSMVLLHVGELESALNGLLQALDLFPSNGDVLYSVGSLYYMADDLHHALGYFLQAAQHATDPAVVQQSQANCADIGKKLAAADGAHITILPQEAVASSNYSRSGDTKRDIQYLLFRLEFGFEVKKTLKQIQQLKTLGKTSRKELLDYAYSSPAHQIRLLKLLK